MTPQRWQLLNQIFQAAVELPESERSAFLAAACAGDDSLRKEVQALLSSSNDGPAPLAEAVGIAAADYISTPESSPAPGQRFGPYEITGRLGSGGMGHVYRALDTRLGRCVALKVLARQYTADSFRVNRFQREARLVSALNHPNLLTVHELGEIDGRQFIDMELVEGRTLHAEIAEGAIPAVRAVDIVMQAARALAAAHEAGIVHRDIKPENIMVRPDGHVKVLDFGTAKLTEAAPEGGAKPVDPMATIPGTLVGTVEYMSPEQACGRPVDARSDIFSLGVVLYELLAGTPPFRGETRTDTLALILQAAVPPMPPRTPELPNELLRITGKMLARKAEDRYASMADLLLLLESARERLSTPGEAADTAAQSAGAAVGDRRPDSPARGAVGAIVAGAAAIGKRFLRNKTPGAGE